MAGGRVGNVEIISIKDWNDLTYGLDLGTPNANFRLFLGKTGIVMLDV